MGRRITTVVRAVWFFAAVALVVPCEGAARDLLRRGDPGPRFAFPDVRSEETRGVDELAPGRPLLLVFLQTACRSCVREVLALKDLAAHDGEVGVLCVFLDLNPRGIEAYLDDYELGFASTWDGESVLADAYGVTFTPTTFLLDPAGAVEAVYAGFTQTTPDQIRADLRRLRRESGGLR